MFKSLNSGARLVELLNSVDRLGELLQLGESNWWNGQIGSDSVKADIRSQYQSKGDFQIIDLYLPELVFSLARL